MDLYFLPRWEICAVMKQVISMTIKSAVFFENTFLFLFDFISIFPTPMKRYHQGGHPGLKTLI